MREFIFFLLLYVNQSFKLYIRVICQIIDEKK